MTEVLDSDGPFFNICWCALSDSPPPSPFLEGLKHVETIPGFGPCGAPLGPNPWIRYLESWKDVKLGELCWACWKMSLGKKNLWVPKMWILEDSWYIYIYTYTYIYVYIYICIYIYMCVCERSIDNTNIKYNLSYVYVYLYTIFRNS